MCLLGVIVPMAVAAANPHRSTAPRFAAGTAVAAVDGVQSPSQAAERLTPADLDERMRKIGPAADSLRMALIENRLGEAAKEAQEIALWFGDVEKFWAQNARPDAVTWSQRARRAATDTAGAAAGGDRVKALAGSKTLLANCDMCHAAYREADGHRGFRIKAGALR
jgi:hypothetical protein